ncbi:MAG: Undecaprenyl-diphosphatase [Planctomycetota bacterium]|jgi:phosphatidylglycerophosphatase A
MWPASGTWGSLPPVLLMAGLHMAGAGNGWMMVSMLVLAVLACVACVRHGNSVERELRRKDPSEVVIDEVAGMAITLLVPMLVGTVVGAIQGQPLGELMAVCMAPRPLWSMLATGFVLFRVTDIVKPPPARGLQTVHAGWGILLDDVFAGLYAGGSLAVIMLMVAGDPAPPG